MVITCNGVVTMNGVITMKSVALLSGVPGDLIIRYHYQSITSSKKSFDIPHPTKEDHRLRYVCVESPKNYRCLCQR